MTANVATNTPTLHVSTTALKGEPPAGSLPLQSHPPGEVPSDPVVDVDAESSEDSDEVKAEKANTELHTSGFSFIVKGVHGDSKGGQDGGSAYSWSSVPEPKEVDNNRSSTSYTDLISIIFAVFLAFAEFAGQDRIESRKDIRAAGEYLVQALLDQADVIFEYAEKIRKLQITKLFLSLAIAVVAVVLLFFGPVGWAAAAALLAIGAVAGQFLEIQIEYEKSQGRGKEKQVEARQEVHRTDQSIATQRYDLLNSVFNETVAKLSEIINKYYDPQLARAIG